ncbi:MAG: CsbD family protein [Phycisphaerales bacterium]|nr:CsbD family protein [Phycisphaerales bacterium]
MSNENIKGGAKQIRGNIKEAVGDLTGDRKLKVDGKLDRAEGSLQKGYGKIKEAVKDTVDDLDRGAGRDR